MWWVWLLYIICLVVTVFTSTKLAEYVDALDKKTKISGAFLGGILLAGITSLPELITSVTSVLLNQPEMTLGNILGSDLFDIAIIGFLLIIFARRCVNKKISKSNVVICIFTLFASILILICSVFDLKIVIPYLNINILTPIILFMYVIALWFSQKTEDIGNIDDEINKDTKMPENVTNKAESLSVKRIIIRFSILAVVLVGVSVAMTYLVDNIATTYNFGKGLAGALFLGIATSLPEIIASFTLVRLGNFDSAFGNIVGSCLFNFAVISLADIVFAKGTVFLTNIQSIILSACLVVACLSLLVFSLIRRSKMKIKNSYTVQSISGFIILASYIIFLILSTTII